MDDWLRLHVLGDAASGEEALLRIKSAAYQATEAQKSLGQEFLRLATSSQPTGVAFNATRAAIAELNTDMQSLAKAHADVDMSQKRVASSSGRLGRILQQQSVAQKEAQSASYQAFESLSKAERRQLAARGVKIPGLEENEQLESKLKSLAVARLREQSILQKAQTTYREASANVGKLTSKYGEAGPRLYELRDSISQVDKDLARSQGTVISSSKTTAGMSKNMEALRDNLNRVSAETGVQFANQEQLSIGLTQTSAALSGQTAALNNAEVSTREYTREVQKANRQVQVMGIEHSPVAQKALNKLSSAAQGAMLGVGLLNGSLLQVGFSLIFLKFSEIPVSLAFAGLAIAATRVIRSLKETQKVTKSIQAMALQLTLAGVSSKVTAEAIAIAGRLTRDFGLSAEDATKGVSLFAGAGFELDDRLVTLARIASATGRSFEDVAKIIVGLVKPTEFTVDNFDDFQKSMYDLIPIASVLGTDVSKVTQTLAKLFGETAKSLVANDRLSTVLEFVTDKWDELAGVQKAVLTSEGKLTDFGKSLIEAYQVISDTLPGVSEGGLAQIVAAAASINPDNPKKAAEQIALMAKTLGGTDNSVLTAIRTVDEEFKAIIATDGNLDKARKQVKEFLIAEDIPDDKNLNKILLEAQGILGTMSGSVQTIKTDQGLVLDSSTAYRDRLIEASNALGEINEKLIRNSLLQTYDRELTYPEEVRLRGGKTAVVGELTPEEVEAIKSGTYKVPGLAAGGLVTGTSPLLATLHPPEAVIPLGKGNILGSTTVIDLRGAYILSERIPTALVTQIAEALGRTMTSRGMHVTTRR